MRLSELSPEAWEEWRDGPVTQAVKSALGRVLDRQREAALQAYWNGQPWPEADRLALHRMAAWHDDFFNATHDEITEAMKDE